MKIETKETQTEVAKAQEPAPGQMFAERVEKLKQDIAAWRKVLRGGPVVPRDCDGDEMLKSRKKSKEEAKALLSMAEAQMKRVADTPLLAELLVVVKGLVLRDDCNNKEIEMVMRIIALLPEGAETDDPQLYKKALEIPQITGCPSCRLSGFSDIIKEFMKRAPDQDAGILAKGKLLSCLEKILSEEAERLCVYPTEKAESDCREIHEAAERKCEKIHKWAEDACTSFREEASGEFRTVQEVMGRTCLAKESGEFQKPDFAKKPAPQPAKVKAKHGDKI
ncbi:hypothetical protein H0O01_03585 [Candidatus Micrarchaeota archaeon]|nr:hypothetical protein [Candidatus Micrarchaeota archaeon]